MFKPPHISEDEDFTITTSTNTHLASLFETTMVAPQNFNTALIYTAPRQPSNESKSEIALPTKPQSSLLHVKLVDAYKLVENSYISQGIYGLALIGNEILKAYEVIIYKDKTNVVSRTKITTNLKFIENIDNSLIFTDDQKQNWSVKFVNTKDLNEFCYHSETLGAKITAEVSKRSSISESQVRDDVQSDSSGKQTKLDILSRMAKMGQPIFPNTYENIKKSGSSDTDAEVEKSNKRTRKIKRSIKDTRFETHNQCQELTPKSMDTPPIGSSIVPAQTNPNFNEMLLAQKEISGRLPVVHDHMNVFLSENRTHNSEIRVNITNLASKLDLILNEVSNNKSPTKSSDTCILESKIKVLELKMLNISKELENSKFDIEQKDRKIKFLLEDIESRTLKSENDNQKDVIADQEMKIKNLQEQNEKQVVELKCYEDDLAKCKESTGEWQQKVLKDFEELYICKKKFTEYFKNSMNEMYQDILQTMKSRESDEISIPVADVKSILAQSIKSATHKILHEL